MIEQQKGFTLVEVLLTVSITLVVTAGLVATVAGVTRGVNDATRKTAQTNSVRGLSEMLRHDLAAAGAGVADLRAYNIHFVLNEAMTGIDPNGSGTETLAPFFYGIDDIDYGSVNTGTFSSITLQWFDYDYTTSANRAIFFASDYTWDTGGTYAGPVTLSTNNASNIDNLKQGDILIFYKLRPLLEADTLQNEVIWNAGLKDSSGNPENEAVILQVGTVSMGGTGGFSDLPFKAQVNFLTDGMFLNQFTQDADRMKTQIEDVSGDLMGNLSDLLHPPKWAFVARKLGSANSFHRVRYFVEYSPLAKTYMLLRSSNVGMNSYTQVVATDIEAFEIRLGLDVPVGISPESVARDQMDGYVSVLESDRWTMGMGPNPYLLPTWGTLTSDQFKIMIGRHAMMADLYFTQKTDDGRQGKVRRSFRQQIRLANSTLPTANM